MLSLTTTARQRGLSALLLRALHGPEPVMACAVVPEPVAIPALSVSPDGLSVPSRWLSKLD